MRLDARILYIANNFGPGSHGTFEGSPGSIYVVYGGPLFPSSIAPLSVALIGGAIRIQLIHRYLDRDGDACGSVALKFAARISKQPISKQPISTLQKHSSVLAVKKRGGAKNLVVVLLSLFFLGTSSKPFFLRRIARAVKEGPRTIKTNRCQHPQ